MKFLYESLAELAMAGATIIPALCATYIYNLFGIVVAVIIGVISFVGFSWLAMKMCDKYEEVDKDNWDF